MQQAQALREKVEREEKLAAAVLKNTPVGIEVSLSTGSMEMKLSKNTPLDMEDRNVTTEDGPIQIKGRVGGCVGNVGLQVRTPLSLNPYAPRVSKCVKSLMFLVHQMYLTPYAPIPSKSQVNCKHKFKGGQFSSSHITNEENALFPITFPRQFFHCF